MSARISALIVKSVYEKLSFHDGLVWMVGLTVEISCVVKLPRCSGVKLPAVTPCTRSSRISSRDCFSFSFSPFSVCSFFHPSSLLTKYILWQVMNGRWFAGRRITAERWDGVTSYKVEETDQQREQRLGEWDRYLSGELDEPAASNKT